MNISATLQQMEILTYEFSPCQQQLTYVLMFYDFVTP